MKVRTSGLNTTRRSLACAEDELQNVEMAEREKEEKNKELKIKRRDYTGYDDEEFAPGQAGMKRAVLAKYDEFLEGSKESVSFDRSFNAMQRTAYLHL